MGGAMGVIVRFAVQGGLVIHTYPFIVHFPWPPIMKIPRLDQKKQELLRASSRFKDKGGGYGKNWEKYRNREYFPVFLDLRRLWDVYWELAEQGLTIEYPLLEEFPKFLSFWDNVERTEEEFYWWAERINCIPLGEEVS